MVNGTIPYLLEHICDTYIFTVPYCKRLRRKIDDFMPVLTGTGYLI